LHNSHYTTPAEVIEIYTINLKTLQTYQEEAVGFLMRFCVLRQPSIGVYNQ